MANHGLSFGPAPKLAIVCIKQVEITFSTALQTAFKKVCCPQPSTHKILYSSDHRVFIGPTPPKDSKTFSLPSLPSSARDQLISKEQTSSLRMTTPPYTPYLPTGRSRLPHPTPHGPPAVYPRAQPQVFGHPETPLLPYPSPQSSET